MDGHGLGNEYCAFRMSQLPNTVGMPHSCFLGSLSKPINSLDLKWETSKHVVGTPPDIETPYSLLSQFNCITRVASRFLPTTVSPFRPLLSRCVPISESATESQIIPLFYIFFIIAESHQNCHLWLLRVTHDNSVQHANQNMAPRSQPARRQTQSANEHIYALGKVGRYISLFTTRRMCSRVVSY